MRPATGRLGRVRTLMLCGLSLALAIGCGVLPGPTAEPSATPPSAPPTQVAPAAAPTATSTSAPATATPQPTAEPPEPGPAPAFEDLGQAVADYASDSGGNPEALIRALEAWDMLPPAEGELAAQGAAGSVVAADLTGDGTDELVVAALNPEPQGLLGEGTLLVLEAEGGRYTIGYDFAVTADIPGPVTLLDVTDVDGNANADVAFASQSCGAHTCFADVRVLAHQDGAYLHLAENLSFPYPDDIIIEDLDGDGLKEISVHGNVIGSVGAGPQRASTMVYGLIEGRYRLVDVQYDASDLLYFRIVDANLALDAGRTDEAIALYTQALQDDSLELSGLMLTPEEEEAALRSFARFRLIVAYAMQNDPSTGRELAQARAEAGPFLPAAEVFWSAYAESQSVEAGCAAVTELAERLPEPLDILNSFGYANPMFSADQLCRDAGSGLPEPQATPLAMEECPRCG